MLRLFRATERQATFFFLLLIILFPSLHLGYQAFQDRGPENLIHWVKFFSSNTLDYLACSLGLGAAYRLLLRIKLEDKTSKKPISMLSLILICCVPFIPSSIINFFSQRWMWTFQLDTLIYETLGANLAILATAGSVLLLLAVFIELRKIVSLNRLNVLLGLLVALTLGSSLANASLHYLRGTCPPKNYPCNIRIVKDSDDIGFCNSVPSYYRSECITAIARGHNFPQVCMQLENEFDRRICCRKYFGLPSLDGPPLTVDQKAACQLEG